MKKIGRCIMTFLIAIMITSTLLVGCQSETVVTKEDELAGLAKLCKVWGYVKYRHPTFLLGQKDWDEELLSLIPQVRKAESEEAVNELLHTWFEGLGEVDYGTSEPVKAWAEGGEDEKVFIADTAWTADTAALGEALTADLAQLGEIPAIDRSKSPGWLDKSRYFANEPEHEAAYDDPGFRLLGLFRLWNAMEYCFPYLDLLDEDWNECLEAYIPQMLDGTDQASYERTLASIAYQLHDPHVSVGTFDLERMSMGRLSYVGYGSYKVPVPLMEAEGQLVVFGTADGCPLERGDVLLAVNGTSIEQLKEERKQYASYPREDAVLNRMRYIITASAEEVNQLTVLRDGQELEFSVRYGEYTPQMWDTETFYQVVEGNIALISPGSPDTPEESLELANTLSRTDGLIIDLRQYPAGSAIYVLEGYLLEMGSASLLFTMPSEAVPGAYMKVTDVHGSSRRYEKPVVILMCNDSSQSAAETAITIFQQAEGAITMGDNSAGGNGTIALLPLPGGLNMTFSSQGVYTPEGERTQRTGIAPDIRVEPTIQGIAEGRDEVLEAAVEYIKNATND